MLCQTPLHLQLHNSLKGSYLICSTLQIQMLQSVYPFAQKYASKGSYSTSDSDHNDYALSLESGHDFFGEHAHWFDRGDVREIHYETCDAYVGVRPKFSD